MLLTSKLPWCDRTRSAFSCLCKSYYDIVLWLVHEYKPPPMKPHPSWILILNFRVTHIRFHIAASNVASVTSSVTLRRPKRRSFRSIVSPASSFATPTSSVTWQHPKCSQCLKQRVAVQFRVADVQFHVADVQFHVADVQCHVVASKASLAFNFASPTSSVTSRRPKRHSVRNITSLASNSHC
jgi:hypothetical protein